MPHTTRRIATSILVALLSFGAAAPEAMADEPIATATTSQQRWLTTYAGYVAAGVNPGSAATAADRYGARPADAPARIAADTTSYQARVAQAAADARAEQEQAWLTTYSGYVAAGLAPSDAAASADRYGARPSDAQARITADTAAYQVQASQQRWLDAYQHLVDAGTAPQQAAVSADRAGSRPADAQARITVDTAAYRARAAKAAAVRRAAVRSVLRSLPPVRVTGGTAAQRAQVRKLAAAAGAPRGTVIRITDTNLGRGVQGLASLGTTVHRQVAGVEVSVPRSTIDVRRSAVRKGGSWLRFVVFHEISHARQEIVDEMSGGAVAAASGRTATECQADRMAVLLGARTVRGLGFLQRGWGRYCSKSGAKAVLTATR